MRNQWDDDLSAKYYNFNNKRADDLEFYSALAERCPYVLDVGAGTGRLAVHLAESGAKVVAIDNSKKMLEHAHAAVESSAAGDNVRLVVANMEAFDLDGETDFDAAIIAGYSFAYMFTLQDQVGCLRSIFTHLAPGGEIVVHMFLPNHSYFASLAGGGVGSPVYEHWGAGEADDGSTAVLSSAHSYSRSRQELDTVNIIDEVSADGRLKRRVTSLRTHVVYPREMEALLHIAGFTETKLLGGYDLRELDDDSWEMIATARKPRR